MKKKYVVFEMSGEVEAMAVEQELSGEDWRDESIVSNRSYKSYIFAWLDERKLIDVLKDLRKYEGLLVNIAEDDGITSTTRVHVTYMG